MRRLVKCRHDAARRDYCGAEHAPVNSLLHLQSELEIGQLYAAIPNAQEARARIAPGQMHVRLIHGQILNVVAKLPSVAVWISSRRFGVTDP